MAAPLAHFHLLTVSALGDAVSGPFPTIEAVRDPVAEGLRHLQPGDRLMIIRELNDCPMCAEAVDAKELLGAVEAGHLAPVAELKKPVAL